MELDMIPILRIIKPIFNQQDIGSMIECPVLSVR